MTVWLELRKPRFKTCPVQCVFSRVAGMDSRTFFFLQKRISGCCVEFVDVTLLPVMEDGFGCCSALCLCWCVDGRPGHLISPRLTGEPQVLCFLLVGGLHEHICTVTWRLVLRRWRPRMDPSPGKHSGILCCLDHMV